MPGYVLLSVHVRDPEEYAAYRERGPATVEQYGGRYLARGGELEIVEGDWRPERIVILEFPSLQRAREWYHSPEYQAVVEMRKRGAPSDVVFLDGLPAA